MDALRVGIILIAWSSLGGKIEADVIDQPSIAYEASLRDWRSQIKKLQGIRDRFATAEEGDLTDLRKTYLRTLAESESKLRNFTDAAEIALIAGGENQKEAGNFLQDRMESLLDRDDFERAFRIGKLLMDNGFNNWKILEATGISAAMTNHFLQARSFLQQADEKKPLTKLGRKTLMQISDLEAAWKEEEQIRKVETSADDLPRVRLSTSQGDVVVELFENEAPETVANFIELVENEFYDGLDFHRVIPHNVAQGGCPQGDGTGGPGYSIRCERLDGGYRRHFRGSVSMARTLDPHTAGSQFFFCMTPLSDLDGQYTVFGRILEGMDVLAKLQRRDGKSNLLPPADRILKAKVERKRDHDYRSVPYVPEELPTSG